ncbi:MAG: ATP phosphoribosyltransferase [Saprospiraceae bacterium]
MNELNIALQKKGRMYEECITLLKKCGFSISNSNDQLKVKVRNFPANLLFLRNGDIPKYVANGVADIGFVGQNTLYEKAPELEKLLNLGFQKCRLSLAVPKDCGWYEGVHSLHGKKVATSYPRSLQQFLSEKGVKAKIHTIQGSVEIAPNIGLADAICDLVSSGSTLFKNGLVEKDIMFKSEACIVVNEDALTQKKELIDELVFRIESVQRAQSHKYILMNVPNDKIDEVSNILPVLKSPTVLPLVEEGWSSLHSVISDQSFWSVISQLKKIGAEGIIVTPIEKMVL